MDRTNSRPDLEGVQVGVIRALPVQANATRDTPFSASRRELRWRWAAGAKAITSLSHTRAEASAGTTTTHFLNA